MILLTQYWNFKTTTRKNEVYNALLKNCMNRYITKIVVFVENNTTISLKHNKIQVIKVKDRLSYYDMVNTALQTYKNQVCIVSNADIHFDGTLSKIYSMDLNNKVISLTSYDSVTDKINDFSVDAWIFKSFSLPFSDCKIGTDFADLKFLKVLMNNNLEVINPSLDVHCYHNDSVSKLKKTYDEEFKFVNPTKLNKTVVIRDNREVINIKNPKVTVVKNGSNKLERKVNKTGENKIIDTKDSKIAVILHLYYQDLWGEFESLLGNLSNHNFDLYVTLTEGTSSLGQTLWITEQVEKMGGTAFVLKNKGLDIGPFLYTLKHIMENNKEYEYVLKLHSKKSEESIKRFNFGADFGNSWRNNLTRSLIGSPDIINNCLIKLNDKSIGMLGSKNWVTNFVTNGEYSMINYYKKIFNIERGNKFIGGTMFWVKYEILKHYFNENNIGEIYNSLESGYFLDQDNATRTHSMERIFGYMVQNLGYLILGV